MTRLVSACMVVALLVWTVVGQAAFAQHAASSGESNTVDILSSQVPAVSGPREINSTIMDIITGASTSGNARAPVGTYNYERTAWLITAAELATAGFPVGTVNAIGFVYSTLPDNAVNGTLNVYMENTSDVTFTRGTSWATITGSMTLVHSDAVTLPVASGLDINFANGNPFSYTGGGLYIAFEYSNPSEPLSVGTVVACNTALTNGLAGAQSNSALPTTLTASSFRPWTRLGTALTDLVKVPYVYALGKIPIPYGVPQVIRAPLVNVSASPQTFDVTVTVKNAVNDSVRFTETLSGVSVSAGTSQIVRFSPWTPTVAENDSIIVQTSALIGEDITANNRAVMVQNVNTNRFSYSQGTAASGGVGFNSATGDFVARFSSGTSAVIDSIQVNFSTGGQPYQLGIWDATGTGNTPGSNIFTSPSYNSVSGVQTIPVIPPVEVNGLFYLGVKQTGTTNVSFSYQAENPIRDSTFYYTSPTGGTSWTDFASNQSAFRFMIEANIAQGTAMVYDSSTTSQNVSPVLPNSTNQQVIGIEVNTSGNLLPLGVTQFSLNTNGTTNAADISNAKIYFTGATPTFSTSNLFGTQASPSGAFTISGSQALIQGTNHFWLTYDIAPGATAGNVVDAECASVTVAGTPRIPTVTAPAGNRQVKNALAAGTYTVGLTLFNHVTGRSIYPLTQKRIVLREVWVPSDAPLAKSGADKATESSDLAPGSYQMREVEEEYSALMENGRSVTGRLYAPLTDLLRQELGLADNPLAVYPTITAALYDLNNLGVAGAVTFSLVDTLYSTSETFPLLIDVTAPGVPTVSNTVTIKPASGVTTRITGTPSGPIFKVFNTNYITIDGSNSGGTSRDMTIQNTGISSPQVLVLGSSGTTPITNCTVKNCVLINGTTSSSAIVISDGVAVGSADGYFNDLSLINNRILNAYMGAYVRAAKTGTNGSGTTLQGNDLTPTATDSIRYIGLYMQGVYGGLIRGNDIGGLKRYDGEIDRGIWLASGTNNTVVEKNKIHDLGYDGVSGYGPKGIAISSTLRPCNNTVKNNMFYNITGDGDSYASFGGTYAPIGIYVFGTRQDGVNIFDNSIYLYGNTLNVAGAYSIGICLDDTCAATIQGNVVHNSLGLLSATGVGAVAIALEIDNGQLTACNYNDFFSNATGSATNSVGKIGASDFATLGAWQSASGTDANSVSGDPLFVSMTDLHITNEASPASNAGASIGGVTDDFDGDARNLVPDIGADEFGSTTAINVALNTGWNMISNPVTNPIPGDSVKQLFPTSINQYAFEFVAGSGYQQRFKMANGKGYWGKFPSATSNPISGSPRTLDTLNVVTGWNMVGTISVAVDTSTIISIPPGIRGSNWFGYSAGYSAVTQLIPGKGYWVKANGAGKFVLNAVSLGAPSKVQATGDGVERLNTLTITDSRGGSQTLYFGMDAQKAIPVTMYAMPPVPPSGAFDARFESADGGSMVQTYAEEGNMEYGVSVQSDAYPLTVSWKTVDGVYELHDGLGGVKEIRGEGSIRIDDARATRLQLKLVAGTEVPSEYALLQNYPNPFNPTTNIKFALPVVSRVDVEVYNVLGQKVATLVNGDLAAGYHIVEWNGTGNTGLQLGSGVYFLRLAATGTDGRTFAEVRKLMMVK